MKVEKKSGERPSLTYDFASWPEFIRETRPFAHTVYASLSDDKHSGATPQSADQMADIGWLDGAVEARKFYELHVDALKGLIEQHEMFYDVEGPIVDVGRIATGEPECCMNFETTRVEQQSPRFVRIVVNVGASGGIHKSAILARGSALCALVDLLEQFGTRCEIAIVDAVAAHGRWYASSVIVKQFDEQLDLPIVAYAIGHPSVLRQHIFRLYGRMGIQHGEIWRRVGYGAPAEVPEEFRGDIYAGCMHYGDSRWHSPEAAQAWIIEQLKAFGVTLKKSA